MNTNNWFRVLAHIDPIPAPPLGEQMILDKHKRIKPGEQNGLWRKRNPDRDVKLRPINPSSKLKKPSLNKKSKEK